MKTCFILGCGPTGANMPDVDDVYRLGVNDAFKFNITLDDLLFINRPRHFNEPSEVSGMTRLDIIKHSYVNQIYTLTTLEREWGELFPGIIRTFAVTRWRKEFDPTQVYHMDSSPFTALSLVFTLGYREIVLWGVDFIGHRYLNAETSAPCFSQFAFAAEKHGGKIYKGNVKSNLNLPVWKS